jgi:hypothetical protein
MANVQIPNLPVAVNLNGAEQIEAVQAGTSVRVTAAQIAQLATTPSSNIGVVTNIAALRATAVIKVTNVLVEGYYTNGDGGGGQFYGVTGAAAGTYVDNGGTIIVPTGGNGSSAWLRIIEGPISVLWFGAYNNATNIITTTNAINNAITAAGTYNESVWIPAGTYQISSPLNVAANVNIFGDGINSTIISAIHNGAVFYCPNNFFEIRNLAILGPNNATYTQSIGISTNTVASTVSGAITFTLDGLYIQKCYTGIYINGSSHATLNNLLIQFNYYHGINGAGSQGKWSNIFSGFNYNDGYHFTTNTSGGINGATPFLVNIETYANGGYGIYVGVNSGLQLANAFLNNDSLGEVYLDTNSLVESCSISNSIIQYAGINPLDPRTGSGPYTGSANAAGIYINTGANASKINLSNITTFNNAGCDIKTTSPVLLTGASLIGCGQGLPAKGGFPAVPADATEIYAFKDINSTGGFNIINTTVSTGPFIFKGNYNCITGCFISNNSATVPSLEVTSTSQNNIFGSSTIYQNNVSGTSFKSAADSTYSAARILLPKEQFLFWVKIFIAQFIPTLLVPTFLLLLIILQAMWLRILVGCRCFPLIMGQHI